MAWPAQSLSNTLSLAASWGSDRSRPTSMSGPPPRLRWGSRTGAVLAGITGARRELAITPGAPRRRPPGWRPGRCGARPGGLAGWALGAGIAVSFPGHRAVGWAWAVAAGRAVTGPRRPTPGAGPMVPRPHVGVPPAR